MKYLKKALIYKINLFKNMLKKFVEFINEEYELITKMLGAAEENKNKKKKFKIPLLQNHAILALADYKDTFAELYVNGNNLTLSYKEENGIEKEEIFNLASFDNVMELVEAAYKAWQKKVTELHLEEEDNILIDELTN